MRIPVLHDERGEVMKCDEKASADDLDLGICGDDHPARYTNLIFQTLS